MKRITIMLVPGGASQTKSYSIPTILLRIAIVLSLVLVTAGGFFIFDYMQLREMRRNHFDLLAENQHLKGEAHILIGNLSKVKKSLKRIQDYTGKLGELVNLKVSNVSRKTGIGPLSEEEFSMQNLPQYQNQESSGSARIPLGINLDDLIFRPVFRELGFIQNQSDRQAVELQHLLSTLSQKKSLLSSVPSLSPVKGWVTSGFGERVSPFTGNRSLHKALDIAAPVGTPVISPADGVVIFSGSKVGFGNFIMIAHYGYGIVTRFGHNAQNMVQAGQKVQRGEQIATVGMTGRTTGPHLHYETWVNGNAVNPKKFILDIDLEFLGH